VVQGSVVSETTGHRRIRNGARKTAATRCMRFSFRLGARRRSMW
jgi:hypothetical protein